MFKKLTIVLALFAAMALAACGGGPGGPGGPGAGSSDGGAAVPAADDALAEELSVFNWADYIDEELLVQYEEQFGVTVIYDTYASNEDLLAKLQAGATGYDVIMPSDYMVAQMVGLDLLSEITADEFSNIGNMDPAFMNAPFDPGNAHCVPYQWGTTGIAYRAGNEYFDANPPTSWGALFDPEQLANYEGEINVLDDGRELPAAAAFYLGIDPNTEDPEELAQIQDAILAAKPFWKTFNSEDYDTSLLIPDEVVVSQSWSGDAAEAYYGTYDEEAEDGNWYYSIPEEGAVKWLDNMCIPASSERKGTAAHFINFLLGAEEGAAITNYTYYASPNNAAKEFILDEILEDSSIFPSTEVQEKLSWLEQVSDDGQLAYDELWTVVKSAN
ncbi:MAG: spermidine/putrescine ABC transporter substrate-binding protein [Chloroflexota bacterium]